MWKTKSYAKYIWNSNSQSNKSLKIKKSLRNQFGVCITHIYYKGADTIDTRQYVKLNYIKSVLYKDIEYKRKSIDSMHINE